MVLELSDELEASECTLVFDDKINAEFFFNYELKDVFDKYLHAIADSLRY
jgi:hypothetical protein